MPDQIDLTKVTSEALRAELDRRRNGAQRKGRPLKYATKAEWAAARAVELRATLAEVRSEYQPGAPGLRKKGDKERVLEAEIQKFDRLATKYRREGV